MLYKWGCDGSSGPHQYKQYIVPDDSYSDSYLFMFLIVPLILRCSNQNNTETIVIWENRRKSSARFCRPIKFLFKKDTAG